MGLATRWNGGPGAESLVSVFPRTILHEHKKRNGHLNQNFNRNHRQSPVIEMEKSIIYSLCVPAKQWNELDAVTPVDSQMKNIHMKSEARLLGTKWSNSNYMAQFLLMVPHVQMPLRFWPLGIHIIIKTFS